MQVGFVITAGAFLIWLHTFFAEWICHAQALQQGLNHWLKRTDSASSSRASLHRCRPEALAQLAEVVACLGKAPAANSWSEVLICTASSALAEGDLSGQALGRVMSSLPAFVSAELGVISPSSPAATAEEHSHNHPALLAHCQQFAEAAAPAMLRVEDMEQLAFTPDLLAGAAITLAACGVKPEPAWLKVCVGCGVNYVCLCRAL